MDPKAGPEPIGSPNTSTTTAELADSRGHLLEGFLSESHGYQRSHWAEGQTDC